MVSHVHIGTVMSPNGLPHIHLSPLRLPLITLFSISYREYIFVSLYLSLIVVGINVAVNSNNLHVLSLHISINMPSYVNVIVEVYMVLTTLYSSCPEPLP